jgi:hypothetical protein
MKSLAELKRNIHVGTQLRCIENTYRPELNGTLRTVVKTQGNAFVWRMEGDTRNSWTNYEKASAYQFDGSNRFSWALGRDDHKVTLEIL